MDFFLLANDDIFALRNMHNLNKKNSRNQNLEHRRQRDNVMMMKRKIDCRYVPL